VRRSASIARNSVLNLVGFAVPLLVGLLTVPVITSELGPARFGLLALAFALLEYSSLFDFGLGAATTRQVSASLARRDEQVSSLIVGSVVSQAALGALGALVLMAAAPSLVDGVFTIPPELRGEAVAVFRTLALMIPPTVVLLSLRGILEAAQRFDLSNGIRIPSSVATFLVPALAASAGYSLPAILVMLLVMRVIICAVMVFLVGYALPELSWRLRMDWSAMRPLFIFGSWMSVSNVVSPLLIYVDRFMLGALVGVSAVGYYTAPFDGVMRMLIIPASLMGAAYPSVSALVATHDHVSIRRIFGKAVRKVVLLLAVPTVIIALAGPTLVRLWLGEAFSEHSHAAVRLLAMGVFVNALAHVPSGFIRAMGRPDTIAKFHVFELLLHVPLAWFLITRFGITGAALAWTIRVTLDAGLLFLASRRMLREIPPEGR